NDAALTYELAQAYLKLAGVQGQTYNANTGETERAAENYQKAVRLFEQITSTQNAQNTDEAQTKLIGAYQAFGMLKQRAFDYAGAVEMQQKALKMVEERVRINPSDANRMLLVRALVRVGDALAEVSAYDDFNAYYKRALPIIDELRQK